MNGPGNEVTDRRHRDILEVVDIDAARATSIKTGLQRASACPFGKFATYWLERIEDDAD